MNSRFPLDLYRIEYPWNYLVHVDRLYERCLSRHFLMFHWWFEWWYSRRNYREFSCWFFRLILECFLSLCRLSMQGLARVFLGISMKVLLGWRMYYLQEERTDNPRRKTENWELWNGWIKTLIWSCETSFDRVSNWRIGSRRIS